MPGQLYEATWGRFSARVYDRFLEGTERAGMRDSRAELISHAEGVTLELGAGTGLNLKHYPALVTELIVTEPDPHMAAQLRAKPVAARAKTLIEAGAEELPFPDDHFDTVVGTLVFCTIPEPGAAISEVARVLRPGGRFLFIEHVRSDDPGTARWQDRLERPWQWIGHGCHCNRDTLAMIDQSPLEVERVEHGSVPKAPPFVRPMIMGAAKLPG